MAQQSEILILKRWEHEGNIWYTPIPNCQETYKLPEDKQVVRDILLANAGAVVLRKLVVEMNIEIE